MGVGANVNGPHLEMAGFYCAKRVIDLSQVFVVRVEPLGVGERGRNVGFQNVAAAQYAGLLRSAPVLREIDAAPLDGNPRLTLHAPLRRPFSDIAKRHVGMRAGMLPRVRVFLRNQTPERFEFALAPGGDLLGAHRVAARNVAHALDGDLAHLFSEQLQPRRATLERSPNPRFRNAVG